MTDILPVNPNESFLRPAPMVAPAVRTPLLHTVGSYRVRLAGSADDLAAAYRLRFDVFNLELQEGLATSYATGMDTDEFDAVCDHLIVEDGEGCVVGTYRLQTGAAAQAAIGYYCEREFDFRPYEPVRRSFMELGRACVHREHRSTEVLQLLWQGISRYAIMRGVRYLAGCCSLTSQDPALGWAVYQALQGSMALPELRTVPLEEFQLPAAEGVAVDTAADTATEIVPEPVQIPKLLRTYLAIGAKICSTPALDRAFGTIDFLTMIDLDTLHPRVRSRFLKIDM